jgi:hypothetical protein
VVWLRWSLRLAGWAESSAVADARDVISCSAHDAMTSATVGHLPKQLATAIARRPWSVRTYRDGMT